MAELPKEKNDKGGSPSIKKAANLNSANQDGQPESHQKLSPVINEFTENSSVPSKTVERYMRSLDDTIINSVSLIEFKKKLEILKDYTSVLKVVECQELQKITVFLGESIRQRLEEETRGKDCPSTSGSGYGKTVVMDRIRTYAADMKRSAEIRKKLEDEIDSTWKNLEEVTVELEVLRRSMRETELGWLTEVEHVPAVPREYVELLSAKRNTLHELRMTIILETFFKEKREVKLFLQKSNHT